MLFQVIAPQQRAEETFILDSTQFVKTRKKCPAEGDPQLFRSDGSDKRPDGIASHSGERGREPSSWLIRIWRRPQQNKVVLQPSENSKCMQNMEFWNHNIFLFQLVRRRWRLREECSSFS